MKGCELKAGGGFVAVPQGTKLVPLTAYLVFAIRQAGIAFLSPQLLDLPAGAELV